MHADRRGDAEASCATGDCGAATVADPPGLVPCPDPRGSGARCGRCGGPRRGSRAGRDLIRACPRGPALSCPQNPAATLARPLR
jgi:hypothetical protein